MPSFSSDSYSTSYTNSNRTEPPSIRDQLETVIEMMGPDTPRCGAPHASFLGEATQNHRTCGNRDSSPLKSSSEADNEDSTNYSNTMTVISSVLKRKLSHSAPESPRDFVQCLYCSQPPPPSRFRKNEFTEFYRKKFSLPDQQQGGTRQKPQLKKSQPHLELVKCVNKKANAGGSKVANNRNRVDVYYFDHGNSAYYKTNDSTPVLMSEILAEKTELYTTKFWAQIFGTLHIGFAFFTSFFLQMLRFVLFSVVRPLTVGTTQTVSDYFVKPFLAVIFNGLLQPPLVFVYNVLKSVRDALEPVAEILGMFLQQAGQIFRWFHLVYVTQQHQIASTKKENSKAVTKDDLSY